MTLRCYNKGCGQDFDPDNNTDESCRHHPGMPFFHDAYKGWSCCNKKSVDFTEFLNIKGCTYSKHSNEKPPETEKPAKSEEVEEPEAVPEPIKRTALERPSFDSPLTTLIPDVAPALKKSIDDLTSSTGKTQSSDDSVVTVGTTCKNSGCKVTYESPSSDDTECCHHPGSPIFHEGLKFWSCCQKRTTDFTAFMNQEGCAYGKHKWIKEQSDSNEINCRYDWHQTGSNVVVAIYAKMYHYQKSTIKLNPIRLAVKIVFPQQDNGEFNLDLELRGIVDVSKATANMLGTKIEIVLPKAEPGHWSNLNFPPKKTTSDGNDKSKEETKKTIEKEKDNESDVDLEDLEPMSGMRLSDGKS